MKVGIDAIQFEIPKIYLPISTLAHHRNIEADKLIKGLGLHKMSFLDVNQDIVTLGANALLKLIEQENINLSEISKIYVGTESGVDNSKPIASYILNLIEQKLGANALQNCDVVDLTFACIGAVDALQTCTDYIRLHPNKKAIVIATDNAKYDLNSTGEYTQGAGAIAMLITANPKIVAFSNETGVSTEGVFDFFKPKQTINKNAITGNEANENWFDILESEVTVIKEQPVFDGQYSNQCYINRITAAYENYKKESNQTDVIFNNWNLILMHLPYCFQGRRTFIEIFANENPDLLNQQEGETVKDKIRALSKSPEYLALVNSKIYPSEIASGSVGNIYTGSIFLGLLSALYYSATESADLVSKKIGFIAYGSGSKSKVFEGEIQAHWKETILKTNLTEQLEHRVPIDFETYEKLHKKEQKTPVLEAKNEFVLDYIENNNPVLKGARYYKFVE
ncbi:hydroxymethylglutaryl-CoA synthase family protein [Flavobacterium channae]|uniref:hydroxymethylglutaryl-CoA synthase family protein n=1 Tax=Flavobacterium channae TaxID=2897181 RepID=UPI001E5E5A4B|nr:hydroxymethylglutaryl-CoA synthase [Flavobacterium channae]UGS22650.1 hydroxymethylglutaryl-CoA synthase [Flavobacterium channae]